jgi:hypothetical protein
MDAGQLASFQLDARPFYAGRLGADGRPRPWSLEDLEDAAEATADPFAGRLLGGTRPTVAVQVEAAEDRPVWVGLDAAELDTWARAMEAMLARWGLGPNDTLACFEYGSSPLVFLTSASFAPYLTRGAADGLRATVLCNDGVASMAGRMVEILRLARPAACIVRSDVLAPMAQAIADAGVAVSEICRWMAVVAVDDVPRAQDLNRYAQAWSVPLRRVARADAAYFLAGDCPSCEVFHVDQEIYDLEALPEGGVGVSARFARTCPAVAYRLEPASLLPPGCERDGQAWRLRWEE